MENPTVLTKTIQKIKRLEEAGGLKTNTIQKSITFSYRNNYQSENKHFHFLVNNHRNMSQNRQLSERQTKKEREGGREGGQTISIIRNRG